MEDGDALLSSSGEWLSPPSQPSAQQQFWWPPAFLLPLYEAMRPLCGDECAPFFWDIVLPCGYVTIFPLLSLFVHLFHEYVYRIPCCDALAQCGGGGRRKTMGGAAQARVKKQAAQQRLQRVKVFRDVSKKFERAFKKAEYTLMNHVLNFIHDEGWRRIVQQNPAQLSNKERDRLVRDRDRSNSRGTRTC
jgi:hypothetical protein